MSEDSLVDCGNAPDVFALSLGRIERLGPCWKLSFAQPQGVGDQRGNVVVLNLILPADELAKIAWQLLHPDDKLTNWHPAECRLAS